MPPGRSYNPSGYPEPPSTRSYQSFNPYDKESYPKTGDYGPMAYSPTTSRYPGGNPSLGEQQSPTATRSYYMQSNCEPGPSYKREQYYPTGRPGTQPISGGDGYPTSAEPGPRYARAPTYNEGPSYVPAAPPEPIRHGLSPRLPQRQTASDFRTIEELYDHVWSGFITRNKKHRVGVDAYLAWGDVAELLTDYNLNISHRTALEEARRISSAVQGVVAFTSQNETQNDIFDSYIDYFASKERVSFWLTLRSDS